MAISPLEQFEIISVFYLFIFDFHLINSFFIYFFNFLFIFSIFYLFFENFFILPQNLHFVVLENAYLTLIDLVISNSGKINQIFFPLIFNLTFVLFLCNIIGMFPFGFTLTSHIIITLFFSFLLFFGMNLLAIYTHKLKFMGLFLPNSTPFLIMPFLFLIEIISYISRLFSLAIRLFANMMSGHTLLKILTTFLFSSLASGGTLLFISIIPFLLLHIIIFMELCIALLQVYVFIVLCSIYLGDVSYINSH